MNKVIILASVLALASCGGRQVSSPFPAPVPLPTPEPVPAVEPAAPPVPVPPIVSTTGTTTIDVSVVDAIQEPVPDHILARWPDVFSVTEGDKTYYISPNGMTVQASLVHEGIKNALGHLTERLRATFYDIRDTRTVVRFMPVEYRKPSSNRPGFDAAWLYRRDAAYEDFCRQYPDNCPDGRAWVAGVTDVQDPSGISTLYVAWDPTNLPLVRAIIQHEALHLIWYLTFGDRRQPGCTAEWGQIDHGGPCDPLAP